MSSFLHKCFAIVLLVFISSCKSSLPIKEQEALLDNAKFFHEALDNLTDVIVHDIFAPPVASRVYAYPCIAAYQTLSPTDPELRDLAGLLNDLGPTPQPTDTTSVSYNLSAMYAFFKVSKTLIFSEEMVQQQIDTFNLQLDQLGISETVRKSSLQYGEKVADYILAWAGKDNYKQTRTYPKFPILDDASKWKPTPPAYMVQAGTTHRIQYREREYIL